MAIQIDHTSEEFGVTFNGLYVRIATPIVRFHSPKFDDGKLELHLDVYKNQADFLADKNRLWPGQNAGGPKTYFEAPAAVAAAVVGKSVPEGVTPVDLPGDNAFAKSYAWLMQQPEFAGATEV